MRISAAKWALAAVVSVTPAMMPGLARATTLNFNCITNNAVDCPIATAQITVDVIDLGLSGVKFRFNNAGPLISSISEAYFDDGALLGISSVTHSLGDPWTGGSANPGNLPGGNTVIPPFQATAGFLAESNPSPSMNGVRPGEYLDVIFSLQGGGTYADVLSQLAIGELRVGMHVIAFSSGGSVSLVNNSLVPVPAAVWLFSSAFGLLGLIRRRA